MRLQRPDAHRDDRDGARVDALVFVFFVAVKMRLGAARQRHKREKRGGSGRKVCVISR